MRWSLVYGTSITIKIFDLLAMRTILRCCMGFSDEMYLLKFNLSDHEMGTDYFHLHLDAGAKQWKLSMIHKAVYERNELHTLSHAIVASKDVLDLHTVQSVFPRPTMIFRHENYVDTKFALLTTVGDLNPTTSEIFLKMHCKNMFLRSFEA